MFLHKAASLRFYFKVFNLSVKQHQTSVQYTILHTVMMTMMMMSVVKMNIMTTKIISNQNNINVDALLCRLLVVFGMFDDVDDSCQS